MSHPIYSALLDDFSAPEHGGFTGTEAIREPPRQEEHEEEGAAAATGMQQKKKKKGAVLRRV